jgi:hypothetical protein
VALQAGDPVNVAYWRRMVRVSETMFRQVYARLSVDPRLELCGESFYNDKIPAGEAAPRARERANADSVLSGALPPSARALPQALHAAPRLSSPPRARDAPRPPSPAPLPQ